MGTTRLVSVIIAFFDPGNFLEEAINSVLSQTYSKWELLLVDDGSSDESTALARGCASQNPSRVRYLEHAGHQNRGACAARNLGIRNAQGDYLAFLDADDVWLPRKLEQQVAILNSHPPVGLVYGTDLWWYSWTKSPTEQGRDFVPSLGVRAGTVYRPPNLLTLGLQSKAPTASPSNLVIRREVIEKVGGFEEEFVGPYQLYEDHAFLAKVYLRFPVFAADQCWIKYRQHPNSCVSKVTRAGQKQAVALYYLEWLGKYLVRQEITDDELQRALRERIWRHRHPALARMMGRLRRAAAQTKKLMRKQQG